MIVRILLLFLSMIILISLCLLTSCYISGENLLKKHGKQLAIMFSLLVLIVIALYVCVAVLGLD